MKNLILICGPNGVGKSAVCSELVRVLGYSAYIDSDHCRFMEPFNFSVEHVNISVSNILHMMVNYFNCSTVENVILQYGLHGHGKGIFDRLLNALNEKGIEYNLCPFILDCELEENIRRMILSGRDEERIQHAIAATRGIYDNFDFPRVNITRMTPKNAAITIAQAIWRELL